ncbi:MULTISPECIES: hypothetical protein [Providencia]|uniref:Uncharacterized protein n=1 Tax=Providencia alcalifaciens 205/92 TaxID=1256988 RepID=A0AAV3M515_9GAMM|nr:hypothetical protein [Providencia alcalifaciens]EUD04257.1 hypothetical protein HMPREF1565_0057 [Providencia alcalifaciens RIMD 1656011]EUD10787.1 hypothetical protein HMPREF1563_0198 [Providencia alcalifaciens 205/92]MTC62403.1 hypothetical protein [Providencia alcalifaciens]WGZ56317.1 hypothetical protein PO864_20215 [Providencia alcalifaciens]
MMMKKSYLITNLNIKSPDSSIADLDIVLLDSDEDSEPTLTEKIKNVENIQKDLNIKVLTKGEWLLFWGNRENQLKQRERKQRKRRSLKEYIQEIKKGASTNNE